MPGKCVFNILWMDNVDYKDWLQPLANKQKAKCSLCDKTFDIGSMGETGLKTHMKGLKHSSIAKSRSKNALSAFLCGKEKPVANKVVPEQPSQPQPGNISSFVATGDDSIKAEIIWALKCIYSHYSYNSCTGINDIFRAMFPDSAIAKLFSCGEKKCAYLCCFGIAPYFKERLLKSIVDTPRDYVLLFDESLNSKNQAKQLDVHIRFWDCERNQVSTRFFTAEFLGHSTAEDLLSNVMSASQLLNLSRLLQISMDGPAVNWKFFDLLSKELKANYNNQLINIGSCGLHIMHNSFKHGSKASKWNIEDLLFALFWLFNDSPAKSEDFLNLSSKKLLPLKFCKFRWLENGPASERALLIWDDIKNYVAEIKKKKLPAPTSKSYSIVLESTKDALMPAKLHFFISVSKLLKPFLTQYQSDKPLLPFFSNDTRTIIYTMLLKHNIIKEPVLTTASTMFKLLQLNLKDEDIFNHPSKVDAGFCSEKAIKELIKTGKLSDKEKLEFKIDCKLFVQTLCIKLLEKSPVNFALVRNLSCLDPRQMTTNKELCITRMRSVLTSLVTLEHFKESDFDDVILQFRKFLDEVIPHSVSDFKNFDPTLENHRLDHFLFEHMAKNLSYQMLWDVVQKLLLLSHGQATVERGFSVNKQIEVENLKNESYIAQRVIHEHIHYVGGIEKVEITKALKVFAQGARQKYMTYLDKSRKQAIEVQQNSKRKLLLDEVEELKEKRKRVRFDIAELVKSADKLAEQAETKASLTYITQSNSFRRTAKEKEEECSALDMKIKSILDDMK